jgi:hypothetical protein
MKGGRLVNNLKLKYIETVENHFLFKFERWTTPTLWA